MSGYASKAEAESIVRATIAGNNRPADLPAEIAAYNMSGIVREVVTSRGHGYGWGIEYSPERFWAAVRANLRFKPAQCACEIQPCPTWAEIQSMPEDQEVAA